MGHTLRALVRGKHLIPASREQIVRWLPAAWRIGDKSGSGDFGTANDVAAIADIARALPAAMEA
jgi:beta-lactamase class A